MRLPPRLSVVINNHNYERYLASAIESVLAQLGPDDEIVVIDDGSTDGSREVIARYGDRLRAVLQENQGQKATFNRGLLESKGDFVLFVDADDVLEPGTLAAVRAAVRTEPNAARIVFRLAVIDAEGTPTGATIPNAHRALPSGDLRAELLAFPDDLAWPPTTGNTWARWALERVLPLPLDDELTGADTDLHTLVPMLGPVVALRDVGGGYRVHGDNAVARDGFDIEISRRVLRWSTRTHHRLACIAADLGCPPARPESVTIAAHRLLSVRWPTAGHPIAGDTRSRSLRAGLRAALGRFDVGVAQRVRYCAWFLAAALAPRRALPRLATRALQTTN